MDPSSYANVDYIQTTDFNLNMNVSFDDQQIVATNILTLRAVQDVSEVVLDYQGLEIQETWYKITNVTGDDWIVAYFET